MVSTVAKLMARNHLSLSFTVKPGFICVSIEHSLSTMIRTELNLMIKFRSSIIVKKFRLSGIITCWTSAFTLEILILFVPKISRWHVMCENLLETLWEWHFGIPLVVLRTLGGPAYFGATLAQCEFSKNKLWFPKFVNLKSQRHFTQIGVLYSRCTYRYFCCILLFLQHFINSHVIK